MGVGLLTGTEIGFRAFTTKSEFVTSAADWIASRLRTSLRDNGQASLALSGGSTPGPIYNVLSKEDLAWNQVTAGLVDERVGSSGADSNMEMVKSTLVQNHAQTIQLESFSDLKSRSFTGYDISLMGMGTDGHTASWFPGAIGLESALDLTGDKVVSSINAKGCSGAGSNPNRMTLTLPAVMQSQSILLLITGDKKRQVFEQSFMGSVYDAPVKALLAAGNRLTVMWAP